MRKFISPDGDKKVLPEFALNDYMKLFIHLDGKKLNSRVVKTFINKYNWQKVCRKCCYLQRIIAFVKVTADETCFDFHNEPKKLNRPSSFPLLEKHSSTRDTTKRYMGKTWLHW